MLVLVSLLIKFLYRGHYMKNWFLRVISINKYGQSVSKGNCPRRNFSSVKSNWCLKTGREMILQNTIYNCVLIVEKWAQKQYNYIRICKKLPNFKGWISFNWIIARNSQRVVKIKLDLRVWKCKTKWILPSIKLNRRGIWHALAL